MKKRVLLVVDSAMLRTVLRDLLEQQPDIEVVGEVADPVDLLLAMEATEADVVIHTFDDLQQPPGICSHLFAEFPGLVIIGISPLANATCSCRQTIEIRSLGNAGFQEVLDEIRSASTYA